MIVFLNGKFLPVEQAHVSVLDRGFIFGDGIYEVIPVYNGKLLRLAQHLDRLKKNLDAIRLNVSMSDGQWEEILNELVLCNAEKSDEEKGNEGAVSQGTVNLGNACVYLQVTRGVAPRDHSLPAEAKATVFAMCNPAVSAAPELSEKGMTAITLEDYRWKNCHIKSISLLPNVLLRQQAVDSGAAEAILIRENVVTEGAASNVFIVQDGTLITPPKGPFLLPGITRDLVLELASENNIACKEQAIKEYELRGADEIWLTSSMKDILPVTSLDGKQISKGKPGPLWHTLNGLLQSFKENNM
ncbi:MAG: D-amino acid aminotransferase [Gammaproteobacteria bacterium]|nr:D-amino acid aminotransferase [Gammaproteobacteria bacterium]